VELVAGIRGSRYLDGGGGDLDVVQLAQGALSVNEVGGGQLVQGLQGDGRGVAQVIAHLGFLAQLPFVHKYCQSLFSCRTAMGVKGEVTRDALMKGSAIIRRENNIKRL